MVWAKFDDGFLDHPKVLRAGEEASNLFIRACIWCSKHLTDGAVPREALRAITQRRDVTSLVEKLVAVGLWETTEDGWQVHDWRDHNPSRESVEGKRKKTREKVANWREKHAKQAESEACNHTCNRVTCEVCNPVTNRVGNRVSNPAPDPTRPDPTLSQDTHSERVRVEGGVESAKGTGEPPRVDAPAAPAPPPPAAPIEAIRLPTHEEIHGLHAAEVVGALRSRAKGTITLAEDSATLAALQKLLRELAVRAHNPVASLAPFEALADWYAAGSQRWRTHAKLTLRALLAPGVLVEHLEEAAQWAHDGRPAITHASREHGPTARAHTSASVRRGPAPVSASYVPDADDDPEMLLAYRAEQKAAGR
jgi:hypothetical protein